MSGKPKAPLLVHIGYHKTATSFLQGQVFSDTNLFSQPWGVMAAQAVESFILTHAERFDAAALRADFLSRLEPGAETVPVISHEALSGQPTGGRYYAERVAARVHETFPKARILIGIREQKKLLASLYYQYVKMGGTVRITEFVKPPAPRMGFRPKVRFEHFEYDLMLQLYRRYWPAEDILVLPMELLAADQSAYVQRLLDFLGLRGRQIASKPSVNVRRSNVTMRLERSFNRLLPPPDPRPKVYADYPLAHRMKNRALALLERVGPMEALGRAEHARIVAHIEKAVGDHFLQSNRRLAEMTGLDLGSMGYFQE